MQRRHLLVLIAALSAAGPVGLAAAQDWQTDPSKFISQFAQASIVDILEANIPHAEKQARFRAMFKQFCDLPTISRFVLGRTWNGMKPEDQQKFLALFEDVTVYTWSRRFGEYSGQTLRVDASVPDGPDGSIVKSAIVNRKGESFGVDWRLRKRTEGLKIVDITIEGVSMAITYQREYATIIRQNGGVPGLLGQLEKQVADLKVQASG